MNWKTVGYILFFSLLASALWWLRRPNQTAEVQQEKMQVAASFYPLAYFAERIGGDKVAVKNLTPAGAEPHDFEPTPADIETIEKSELLLLNGRGFEAWAEDLQVQNDVEIIKVAEGASEESDPHVWLDPFLVRSIAVHIFEALAQRDPENRPYYAANSVALMADLDQLNLDFEAGLKQCRLKTFITSHAAFGYWSTRYGVQQVSIAGLSPEEEPTPQDLAEVAKIAKEYGVKHIFFETLVSPRLAETVADEVGAQTLVLNPIEGLTDEEIAAQQDYFSVQRKNLENLRIALDCE